MKKIVTFLCVAVMLSVGIMFTGCDNRPVLKMATNAAFAPFEYKEGNKFKGVDIELAEAIAKELGYRLKINDMEFDSVITSVSSGLTDFAMAGLTVSEERAVHVDFSSSYFDASQYIIVDIDDTTFDALDTVSEIEAAINNMAATAKIGFQSGTTGQYYAEGDEGWGFDGFEAAEHKPYSNGVQAVNDLILGRCNIVVIDEMPARSIVAAKATEVKLIEVALTDEEYAIGVKKGNTELLTKINNALTKFKADGTFQAIIDKYFGS